MKREMSSIWANVLTDKVRSKPGVYSIYGLRGGKLLTVALFL